MGFHYIETDNTRLQIVEGYVSRPVAFKEQMDKRGLAMTGFAQSSAMSDSAQRAQVIEQNLRVGRFLKAVGGKYITLFSPRPNLAVSREKLLENMSQGRIPGLRPHRQRVGQTAARRNRASASVTIPRAATYASASSTASWKRPWYFDFWPDAGHLTAGGANPLEVYKKHRSRMIGTHFKDYDPTSNGNAMEALPKGICSPGQRCRQFSDLGGVSEGNQIHRARHGRARRPARATPAIR